MDLWGLVSDVLRRFPQLEETSRDAHWKITRVTCGNAEGMRSVADRFDGWKRWEQTRRLCPRLGN